LDFSASAKQGGTMEQPIRERFWTPKEIAEQWQVGIDTVRRAFEHEPDVFIVPHTSSPQKRRYRTMRIPDSVLLRVQKRRSLASIDNRVYAARRS
jgi:hypothetical protein